jgi:hypothetical protein
MICNNSCILAGAFIFASIYVSLNVNKKTLQHPLFKILNQTQKKKYAEITNERKNIYLKGFLLGFIFSISGLILLNNFQLFKMNKFKNICFVISTSFTINYFFYILYPKSDYMVKYLETTQQKQAWLEIYKTMQFNYHLGFAIGLVGMIFVGNTFC